MHAWALADALRMRDVLVPPDPGTFSAHGMRTADRRRDFVQTLLVDADDFKPVPGATVDARYVGQSHELNIAADDKFIERFHKAHMQAYGYCDLRRRIEVVNLRRSEIDAQPKEAQHPPRREITAKAGPARMDRAELDGAVLGPTVLTEATSTTIIPEGWKATRLVDGTLLLERIA